MSDYAQLEHKVENVMKHLADLEAQYRALLAKVSAYQTHAAGELAKVVKTQNDIDGRMDSYESGRESLQAQCAGLAQDVIDLGRNHATFKTTAHKEIEQLGHRHEERIVHLEHKYASLPAQWRGAVKTQDEDKWPFHEPASKLADLNDPAAFNAARLKAENAARKLREAMAGVGAVCAREHERVDADKAAAKLWEATAEANTVRARHPYENVDRDCELQAQINKNILWALQQLKNGFTVRSQSRNTVFTPTWYNQAAPSTIHLSLSTVLAEDWEVIS